MPYTWYETLFHCYYYHPVLYGFQYSHRQTNVRHVPYTDLQTHHGFLVTVLENKNRHLRSCVPTSISNRYFYIHALESETGAGRSHCSVAQRKQGTKHEACYKLSNSSTHVTTLRLVPWTCSMRASLYNVLFSLSTEKSRLPFIQLVP